MAANNYITFCSYNANNFDTVKYESVKEIFPKCDFLLLQETWLTENEFIRRFKNEFSDSECISASQMDLDGIKPGRPYGGIAICYHTNLKCKIVPIQTISKSICAVKISIDQFSILLVNVYMPCSDDIDAIEKYKGILEEISSICFNSDTQHLILAGDWNADPNRNDVRTTVFRDFISEEKLYNALDKDISNVPYTYWNQRVTPPSTSTIDHFLLSPNLVNTVVKYETVFQHNDFSDHFPVMLSLNIDVKYHETMKKEFTPCVAWHKCDDVNIASYRNKIDSLLLDVNPMHEALTCRNYKCSMHKEYINQLHSNIINICSEASKTCLPHSSGSKSRRTIPGWNEYVKEHADNAKVWHDVWMQSGKPRHGDIANMKRKTRLKYHYAIRFVKKENIRIRNNRMGEAISTNNDRELWKEVKKMTKSNNNLPNVIDGFTEIEEISGIFADKYDTLYNSVSYNLNDLSVLKKNINSRITNLCPSYTHTITVVEIKNALTKLKLGKKEESGLFSNHLIYGSDRLIIMITLLFNSMLVHGIAPDELILGTMIPLIKDSRASKQCSDNYRALTIGTSLSKLLDIVILNRQKDVLETSELQFGFKEKLSTTMCSFMVLETIAYYKSKGSNVHVLLLDASKAFDRVDYVKLFEKLVNKGMCPLTIRLLLNMYTHQKLQVKWNNTKSDKFSVTNGVRQGGVLSPYLFSFYMDELLVKLKENGVGCHIDHCFVGAFGYADDIILLCPSLEGIRDMIKICEDYASTHSILFNGKKSKYLIFGDYEYNVSLTVNNEQVPRSDSAIHLGHLLHTGDTYNEMTEDAIKNFNKSVHGFMARFSTCNIITKNRLYHQYCQSMYGSQLWLITSPSVKKMYTQWRINHRRVMSVPSRTHCDLLPLIANNMSIETRLDCKYIAFYKSIATSTNRIVKHIAISRLGKYASTMGRNMMHLMHKYNICVDDILETSKKKINEHCYQKWLTGINAEYPINAHIIRELIRLKEGTLDVFIDNADFAFSYDEFKFIIDYLCVN